MKIETREGMKKEVVAAISKAANEKAVFLGPPTFSYRIGGFTVDRNGTVETQQDDRGEKIRRMLEEKGLTKEDSVGFELNVPLEGHTGESLRNLVFMIRSKQILINKAVGSEVFRIGENVIKELEEMEPNSISDFKKLWKENKEGTFGIDFTEDTILFTGFPRDVEHIKAFIELAALMAATAKRQKRVSPKETMEENEKYYMRAWLIRLGFSGEGGRETRKVFLKNLKGHTAFRTLEEIEKAKDRAKARKKAERQEEETL